MSDVVVFDFDGVLCGDDGAVLPGLVLLSWYYVEGFRVVVVTGRSGERVAECRQWLDNHSLDDVPVYSNTPGRDAVEHKAAWAAEHRDDVRAWFDDDVAAALAVLDEVDDDATVFHVAWPSITLMSQPAAERRMAVEVGG